ncbi:MAG: hypothetical protein OQJ99_08500 [Rhodospirillales bacterium]|nr:hypothetical protein [Rhodospirillales bacterium]MCW8862523.1 hypothetical protein [Rhodospirillales bacterium]MCW8952642.1 hypothetical protein [Rhodospirillales bacterium]MCW8971426.1 hypothetical protein [Rhodospirillales bacterium]MCW9001779.1 hypothetical protein [Rhodospirillales bacterium]
MKNCLLCPKGTRCKGFVLHGLIVKIYNAIVQSKGENELEAITKEMSLEDMELLMTYGGQARETCWSKGMVLAVARILAHLVSGTKQKSDFILRTNIEQMLKTVMRVMSRLPKGVSLDLHILSMDIYNRSVQLLERSGDKTTVPLTTFGQACANVLRESEKKRAAS